MPIVNVDDTLFNLELNTAKIKLVNQEYPGFKLKYDLRSGEYDFSSTKVKNSFNDLKINELSHFLSIQLSRKLDFVFRGKTETVIVNNSPLVYNLGTIHYEDWNGSTYKNQSFVFYKNPFTCKDKLLKKQTNSAIDVAILNFIKNNPGVKLDKNELSDRVQKLLILT